MNKYTENGIINVRTKMKDPSNLCTSWNKVRDNIATDWYITTTNTESNARISATESVKVSNYGQHTHKSIDCVCEMQNVNVLNFSSFETKTEVVHRSFSLVRFCGKMRIENMIIFEKYQSLASNRYWFVASYFVTIWWHIFYSFHVLLISNNFTVKIHILYCFLVYK